MTRRHHPAALNPLVLAALLLLHGCGDPSPAGMDSGPGGDAGTPPAPDGGSADAHVERECVAGSVRVVACGSCGTANQVCGPDSTWMDPGECLGAGVCEAGTIETEPTERCGSRRRTCDAACAWAEWEQSEPDGECIPGEERRDPVACGPNAEQLETCTDACTWTAPECIELCGPGRRTSPPDAEEICIPAGPFIRGSDRVMSTRPVSEVMMSSYFIDRFPVTNDRYRACVSAGACTQPVTQDGRDSLADPTRGRYPVQDVNRTQSLAFCGWDGGRTLPTEARWAKAARGPSPRMQPYTWEGDFDCLRVSCRASPQPQVPQEVDGIPGVISYYGVEMMLGGGYEWTWDLYSYYSPDPPVDPAGPDGEGSHVCRGRPSGTNSSTAYELSNRYFCSDISVLSPAVFRCARSVSPSE